MQFLKDLLDWGCPAFQPGPSSPYPRDRLARESALRVPTTALLPFSHPAMLP